MSDIYLKQDHGQEGVTVETGTTAVTGDFYRIDVLVAATFTLFTEAIADGDPMTGFAVPAGTSLYGSISAFTMSSGAVRAYHRSPLQ